MKCDNLKQNIKKPRILVICALPITKSASTRAFYTYLSKIPVENIGQIYSNPSHPSNFDLCNNFYQITDFDVLKASFKRNKKVGRIITNKKSEVVCLSNLENKSFSFGKKDYSFMDLLRSSMWKRRIFLNKDLKKWLKELNPDIIFFHNSHALFMQKLLFAVQKYLKKPVVMEISDDYFFNYWKAITPFSFLRKHLYKKRFRKAIRLSSNQIYVSEKMKNKYNSYFNVSGESIHISSSNIVWPKQSKPNEPNKIVIGYFGNTGLGRDKSIFDIAKCLPNVLKSFEFNIYSPSLGNSKEKIKNDNFSLNFKGFVPYDEMISEIKKCDVLVFTESFKKKMIRKTEYSLSTKISDYLTSGVPIFAYGPIQSGSISFLKDNSCAIVCTEEKQLQNELNQLFNNKELVRSVLKNANETAKKIFDFEDNQTKSFTLLSEVAFDA